MVVLGIQIALLLMLVIALALWAVSFPYPSLLIRRWLPPKRRWPEAQIREWLVNRKFHRSFLGYFYRDPERMPPDGPSIVSPADGLITSASINQDVLYLVIALSFWDMHVQRSPLAGTIVKVESSGDGFMDGEGREFAFLREKRCPVQQRLIMDTRVGTIAVRLITSIAARRIETWVEEGDAVDRGQRIGRILLGSTVVLELPPLTQLSVKVGDRVRAGETPVAQILELL